MKPEEKARQVIDKCLEEAGWVVQDFEELKQVRYCALAYYPRIAVVFS